jgi:hemerythrin-like domain-containing protein
MLTTLGRRSREPGSMRDRLLDCHTRIRTFCTLARRLSEGGPPAALQDAARELERYFRIGLPLHVRDEDESVRPRLERLGDRTVVAALEAMSAEHVTADTALLALTEQWSAIAREPTDARCQATREAAVWLDGFLQRHLEAEEQRIFPALDRLPETEHAAIVVEMKARRHAGA